MKLTEAAIRRKKKKQLARLERQYFSDMHQRIDQIFQLSDRELGWSWAKLADKAGLSYLTVRALGQRETYYPREMTIWKLAKAVGMKREQLVRPVTLRKVG